MGRCQVVGENFILELVVIGWLCDFRVDMEFFCVCVFFSIKGGFWQSDFCWQIFKLLGSFYFISYLVYIRVFKGRVYSYGSNILFGNFCMGRRLGILIVYVFYFLFIFGYFQNFMGVFIGFLNIGRFVYKFECVNQLFGVIGDFFIDFFNFYFIQRFFLFVSFMRRRGFLFVLRFIWISYAVLNDVIVLWYFKRFL